MHVFYLHGFASSAKSSKAAFFASKLAPLGIELHTPDFNQPDFFTLTITRMVAQLTEAIDALPPAPVILIGSSLGAFVAVQTALSRAPQIDRLILLAPALDFGGNRLRDGGRSRDVEGLSAAPASRPAASAKAGERDVEDWKRTGRLEVFHYGYGRMMPVHYDLYADASRLDCVGASLQMPILIFQGRRDTVVDPETVERWASARPNVQLHLLDDDHQLGGSLPYIWNEARRFITSRSLYTAPGSASAGG